MKQTSAKTLTLGKAELHNVHNGSDMQVASGWKVGDNSALPVVLIRFGEVVAELDPAGAERLGSALLREAHLARMMKRPM